MNEHLKEISTQIAPGVMQCWSAMVQDGISKVAGQAT
jgi:hypothetical protein